MKNKAKRIVSAVCALAMCAALAPAAAFAEDNAAVQAQTPSTMSICDWLDDRTVEAGDSIQIEGSHSLLGSHRWEVCDGDRDCVELSNANDRTVTVTGVKEGTVKLRHVITGWRTEYVKVCVKPADPTEPDPEPEPDPSEGEGIYFYVALPSNQMLSDEAADYRFLTYGGKASDEASHDMKAVIDSNNEENITKYIAEFPEELGVGYPASISAPTSAELDGDENSWMIDAKTGDVSKFSFTIDGTTYTEDAYGLRWAKFSYAYTTDVVGNAYHADAQLYKKTTIDNVLDELKPMKEVEDFVLNADGEELTCDTFSFVLVDSDNKKIADLTATVNGENVQTPIELAAGEENEKQVLTPGEYTIREVLADDEKAWQATGDEIEFTVASNAKVTVKSEDEVITNIPATYTVTYNDGVEGEEITVPVDNNNYKCYAEATVDETVPTRDGYDFLGWSLTPDGEPVTEKTLQITGDVTLYAQWAEKTVDPDPEPDPDPDEPAIQPAGSVDLNKTAAPLVNDQTDVTLSIGATEGKEKVAVMFLLDKSTSQGMRDEAAEMLDELADKLNTDILYDVVIFSGTATSTGWQDIQDSDTLDTIKTNFVNGQTTSGTNMDAGIEMATVEMEKLPDDFADATTYLVTLSDGITYVWTGEDGQVKCVPVQGIGAGGNVETKAQNGVDTWSMFYDYGAGLASVYAPDNLDAEVTAVMNAFKNSVVNKMENTQEAGSVKNYYSENNYDDPISTYIYDEEANAEVTAKYACGPEFAMYESATGYEELVKLFDHSYAYAVPEANEDGTDNMGNWDSFPWGRELMEYCQSLSSNHGQPVDVSNADAEEIFASIADQIIYAIQSGTVTDVIGDDFDLSSVDTFTLTVGGEEIKGAVNGNTVNFGDYTVTYYPEGTEDETREHFVWEINTPVENAAPAKLTYTLKLVNKAAEPGDYVVPTNEEAVLEYTSSNGGSGSEEFPVPEVTYNVPETSTTVTTPKPDEHPDIAEGIANGTWGGKPTATPAPSSTIPQTGDDLPLGLLIVVAIAAAGAAGGLIVLRKRSKQ